MFRVASPILRYLRPKIEVDLGAQEFLDLGARGGANLAQPCSTLPMTMPF
jgi:hypothetical protein